MSTPQTGSPARIRKAVSKSFNYDDLPKTIAAEMRESAGRIRQHTRAAFVEVGRELIAAKAQVEHGSFQAWVKAECQISPRTAARAMQVAELVDKNDKLSFLPPDGLLALASPSSPEDTVTEIIQRIEAGETPTAADIKREIRAAKVRRDPTRAGEQQSQDTAESRPDEHQQEPAAHHDADIRRVVDILIEKLGSRITDVVRLLENTTAAELAKALRERRPDLFDPDEEEHPELVPGARPAGEEAGICVLPPGAVSAEPPSCEAADAPANPSPPAPDAEPPASDSSFKDAHEPPRDRPTPSAEPISDRLEAAYLASSPEDRARDLDWVMRRLTLGEAPSEPNPFLAQYLAATPAEQTAFRRRRAAEPTRKAA